MRPRLIREPIHLNVSNRGRLRKIEHQKKEPPSPAYDLSVAVKGTSQDNKTQIKKRLHYDFKKLEDRAVAGYASEPEQPAEVRKRDFRAIHTANSHQMNQAYANRSLTPRTYFNNAFRSISTTSKRKTRTSHSKYAQASSQKYPQIHNSSASPRVMYEEMYNYNSLDLSSQQVEEFYRYKHDSINKTANVAKLQNPNLISGMKIEPFQKSQMRETLRGGFLQKLQRYHFVLNQ